MAKSWPFVFVFFVALASSTFVVWGLSSCATATTPAVAAASDPRARSSVSGPFSAAPTTATFALLHISDSEAGILADDSGSGGVARAHAILSALRSRHRRSVVVHAGDTMIPSAELMVEVGGKDGGTKRSAILAGNDRLGMHAAALGNHDLDLGESFLAETIQRANFPWIASTLRVTTGPLVPLVVDQTTWVHEARGHILRRALACTSIVVDGRCTGEVVGLVASSPESMRLITRGIATLHVPDSIAGTVARLQVQVDALRDEGVTTIVLLSHRQDIDADLELVAAGLTGVDVIVSGGGEEILAARNHRVGRGKERDVRCRRWGEPCYPLVRIARDGAPVALAATAGDLQSVGELIVSVDERGVLTGVDVASRAWPVDDLSLRELQASPAREDLAFEEETRAALVPLQDVVGETPVFLDGIREHVRNGETNLGNASADAMLQAARRVAPQTALALRSAGGLRGSIGTVLADGTRRGKKVTVLDLKSTFRFDAGVVLVEVTHAALARTVESALRGAGSARGQFPQVSHGVELVWATTGADQEHNVVDGRVQRVSCEGTRLRRMSLPGRGDTRVVVVEDGIVVTPEERVVVATLEFLADGGDGWFPGMRVLKTPTNETEQSSFRQWLADPEVRTRSLSGPARIIASEAYAPASCLRTSP